MDAYLEQLKIVGRHKDRGRKRVHSLEIIGMIDLMKALVRFEFNLTVMGCRAFENRVLLTNKALGRNIDFISPATYFKNFIDVYF